ncbi:hypothetical protein ACHAXT_010108 [Thalassiosira profunda]
MVALIRPAPLHLVLVALCLGGETVHVDGWSATSYLFGSGDTEDAADKGADAPAGKRTLASFGTFSKPIPVDEPVTKRGRRDIEASVKAHAWPTTPFSPLCEAWAYLETGARVGKNKGESQQTGEVRGEPSAAWGYLDAFSKRGAVPSLDAWLEGKSDERWSYQNSSALAVDVASLATESSPLDRNLLPMALSLRAHSPHCEMHRTLARDAALAFALYDMQTGGSLPAAFAIVSRVKKDSVLGSQVILDGSLLQAAVDALQSNNHEESDNDGSSLLIPLPHETYHPSALEEDSEIVAILYGQVGSTAFASMYQSMKESKIPFVVRHMGHMSYEEETKGNSMASPTVLQGYGVRLDIRNVEYKAFDDSPGDKEKDGNAEPDWTEAGHKPEDPARDEYLAGVNLQSLLGRVDDTNAAPLSSDIQALQTALIQSHPSQLRSEAIVPPAWQRRPLSLQAATVITASSDPLETLKGVSQNLPSVAHSLANVQVPKSFEELAEEATNLAAKVGAVSPGWGDAAFGLYVNSRPVDVERPSFNIFQLLDVIRAEDRRLRALEAKVRPLLKSAGDDEWAALQAVRRMMDMGAKKLTEIGKKGSFDDGDSSATESDEYGDEYMDDEEEEESSEKYRIDVGRGGKAAVLYLNDIEKDPEYSSWPSSMQEMMYRAQFGGAPTVRRNLFTMLVVIDPTDAEVHPALSAVANLMNSQFPLRLGVLIVDDDDAAAGVASPPSPWDGGERSAHARDASLLLKYVTKEYGGMAAISCLLSTTHEVAEAGEMTANEYIGSFLSLLAEMGLLPTSSAGKVKKEMEALLEADASDAEAKSNDVNYDTAVQFAAEKLLRPGMSFFNGLPLPTGMDAFRTGINDILQYEQRHIMELVMKGAITDNGRSIYARLLSGDKLFKQYHPLLRESGGEYTVVSPQSDASSLMMPTSPAQSDLGSIDAIFLLEGVFDLDSPGGIDSAVSFLDLVVSPPEAWHESKSVLLAFRVLPSAPPTSTQAQVLANILSEASQFDLFHIQTVLKAFQGAAYESVPDAIAAIEQLGDLSSDILQKMADVAEKEKSPVAQYTAPQNENFYAANGRIYVPIDDDPISISDVKMLVAMEMDKTHAMTKLLLPHLLSPSGKDWASSALGRRIHQSIGTTASVLNDMMPSTSKPQQDYAATFDSLQREEGNPLYFAWNEGSSSSTKSLQVQVSVILDPLTEPTQRVAPLLIAIRDHLKLPLRLALAPRQVVQNDAPLSSYYRFVADPTAFPDSNPPSALFQNLPTNHLLTLRMDVPELWDVQQAYAIQDADNLRCDASGCGDEAVGGAIELSRIEYTLKSLLFFGQCYDVSQSTPPNGLQLTLDRSKSPQKMSESELNADGSQQLADSTPGELLAEHTDTLVMKTAGYWQLRANPGVWDMRIAEGSRGAEIYHMVEGSVAPSGRITLAKNATESSTKTLVMRDFSNQGKLLLVKRRKGYEEAELFSEEAATSGSQGEEHETVHVFSLATGHSYERLLKIMMLSVTKRTTAPVKFWLFENFLSPSFKASAKYMAEQIGCEVEFVTYKWPEWLRSQSEKQRLIWGYKILFLDVLFPLDVKKIIYVDADQVLRGSLTELWDLDLEGAPYGYTPMCSSRKETLGYQFWNTGFWKSHLREKPYHISALYVVDLERFRRELVGDRLRSVYQSLTADPNSLANLDQDLPNYAQHDIRIFSLPQKWLWCESWCSDETKAEAMTIDLCNNPEHKEAKISMAKRIISGDLFEESWEELDAEVARFNEDFLATQKAVT